MVSIVLAHRLRMLREGIREFLCMRGCTVMDEADNGLDAVRLAVSRSPDVTVFDTALPRLNGLDATLELRRAVPQSRTVLLLGPEDELLAAKALRVGVSGLVLTSGPLEELVTAVERASRGGRYVSARLAETVLDDVASGAGQDHDLTLREREVLQLLTEGGSTREIAGALHISPRTVESHRKSVVNKLRVHSVAGLTKYAIRHRITSLET